MPDEDAHTYNVIRVTTKVVAERQEYLANYMAGPDDMPGHTMKPGFQICFGSRRVCVLCMHAQNTALSVLRL